MLTGDGKGTGIQHTAAVLLVTASGTGLNGQSVAWNRRYVL